ncbi:MAG TPA: hypothetical protein ENJ93_05795, partial [Chloroflexi bacterium]|nr:hypothetical protein [Chloroflexota bacterium]
MTAEENEPTDDPTAVSPPPSEAETAVSPKFPWESLAVVILILILAVGAYFRFTGLNWDENFHLHPDERFLTIVASQLKSVPDPLTYLKTSESTLNPYNTGQGFYVYGNFPMTVTRYVAEWAEKLCQPFAGDGGGICGIPFTGYDGVHLLGRFLSGLLDLVSVLFIFLIGRRLYDWRVGLLASLLLALAVMPIQQSHFFTMDNWAAGLTTLAIYTAVRAAGLGDKTAQWRLRWYALFGLAVGLALASRINLAPLALIINLSALIWLVLRGQTWESVRHTAAGKLDLERVILGIILAAVITIVTFRLAQPYAFADAATARDEVIATTGQEPGVIETAVRSFVGFNPQFRSNMEEIQRLQSPDASFPPATQWTNRAPILFPWTNMVLYGMGLLAGLAAWFGFFWALWRIFQGKPDWVSHAIPVAWSGMYFLFMGTRWVKSIRYFLPIYPMLLLLGAWALFALWDRTERQKFRQILAGGLIATVVLFTFAWAWTFLDTYKNPVTRVAASAWMYENIPSGATLIYKTDGVEKEYNLPLKEYGFVSGSPLTLGFPMPEDGVITAVRLNYLQTADGSDNQPVTFAAGYTDGNNVATAVALNSQ